jgi:hypothetical protein
VHPTGLLLQSLLRVANRMAPARVKAEFTARKPTQQVLELCQDFEEQGSVLSQLLRDAVESLRDNTAEVQTACLAKSYELLVYIKEHPHDQDAQVVARSSTKEFQWLGGAGFLRALGFEPNGHRDGKVLYKLITSSKTYPKLLSDIDDIKLLMKVGPVVNACPDRVRNYVEVQTLANPCFKKGTCSPLTKFPTPSPAASNVTAMPTPLPNAQQKSLARQLCSRGYFRDGGSYARGEYVTGGHCEKCPEGKFQKIQLSNLGVCKECPVGKHQFKSGQFACAHGVAVEGMVLPDTPAPTPSLAPPTPAPITPAPTRRHTSAPTPDPTSDPTMPPTMPLPTPVGTQSPTPQPTQWPTQAPTLPVPTPAFWTIPSGCAAGKFGKQLLFAGIPQIQCYRCNIGTFQKSPNQYQCERCPPGSYQPLTGKTSCQSIGDAPPVPTPWPTVSSPAPAPPAARRSDQRLALPTPYVPTRLGKKLKELQHFGRPTGHPTPVPSPHFWATVPSGRSRA